jgi:hypothetical protein
MVAKFDPNESRARSALEAFAINSKLKRLIGGYFENPDLRFSHSCVRSHFVSQSES